MPHELEIEIRPEGSVHVTTHGLKGPDCLEYVRVFEEFLGSVQEQEFTREYHQRSAASAKHGTRASVFARARIVGGGGTAKPHK